MQKYYPYLTVIVSVIFIILTGMTLSGSENIETEDAVTTVSTTTATTTDTQLVNLYYYSPEKDMDESGRLQCSAAGLIALPRQIEKSETPIVDTLQLLLSGDQKTIESRRGVTTEFPLPDLALVGVHVRDGVAVIALDDPKHRTSGGSCRATVLRKQVTETVMQFPAVAKVRFIPDMLFQP